MAQSSRMAGGHRDEFVLKGLHRRAALGQILNEILGEEEIERPVKGDANLLLEARELAQVNRSPQDPGCQSRELEAEDVGDAGAAADRGELAQGGKFEGALRAAADCGLYVSCDDLA